MPANQKYLSSPSQRVLKISAGVIGGYLLAGTLHLAAARIPVVGMDLLLSGVFTVFILWPVLMILAFISKNGWRVWAVYLGLSVLLGITAYSGGSL
jgi:hypothetical protein